MSHAQRYDPLRHLPSEIIEPIVVLEVPQIGGEGAIVLGSYYKGMLTTINPQVEKVVLGKGWWRFDGSLALVQNSNHVGDVRVGYNYAGNRLRTVWHLVYGSNLLDSHSESVEYSSTEEGVERVLGGAFSSSLALERDWRFVFGCRLQQNFLQGQSLYYNLSDSYMKYEKNVSYEPNLEYSAMAALSRPLGDLRDKRFEMLVSLEYEGGFHVPSIQTSEELVDFAEAAGFSTLIFERSYETFNRLRGRIAIVGPSFQQRVVAFKREKRKKRVPAFSLDMLDFVATQGFKVNKKEQINYRFYDGVVDSTHGEFREGTFDVVGLAQAELLIFQVAYFWGALRGDFVARNAEWYDGTYRTARFNMQGGFGIRGKVTPEVMLDFRCGVSLHDAPYASIGVRYLF